MSKAKRNVILTKGKCLEKNKHSDAENNDGQFLGVAGQEPAQIQQQERFIEHVHKHRPGKYKKRSTKKRKNIVMDGCVQGLSLRYL